MVIVDTLGSESNDPAAEALVFSYAKISTNCENREAEANRTCNTK